MPNIIDTRDLQKRLEEMEDELETLQDAVNAAEEELNECEDPQEQEALADALDDASIELDRWRDKNQEELEELRQLADEIPNWKYGESLINDDYFVEYAADLADDLYDMNKHSWPFDCIDWDAAADALKMDYSSCEYQGETYWFRG